MFSEAMELVGVVNAFEDFGNSVLEPSVAPDMLIYLGILGCTLLFGDYGQYSDATVHPIKVFTTQCQKIRQTVLRR